MKNISFICITIFLLVIFSACNIQKRDPNTLIIATSGDTPPFNFYNDDNKLVGYDIDISNEIAKRLGKKIEFTVVPFSRFMPLLTSNRIDMIVSALDKQPDLQKLISFSDDYMYAISFFAVKEDTDISSYFEVNGTDLLIGVTNGTYAARFLKDQSLDENVRIFPSKTDLYMALNTNKIVGIIVNEDELNYLNKKISISNTNSNIMKLKAVDNAIYDHHLSIGLNKKNIKLLNEVNKIIEEMKKDGTINRIGLKWLEREPYPRYK